MKFQFQELPDRKWGQGPKIFLLIAQIFIPISTFIKGNSSFNTQISFSSYVSWLNDITISVAFLEREAKSFQLPLSINPIYHLVLQFYALDICQTHSPPIPPTKTISPPLFHSQFILASCFVLYQIYFITLLLESFLKKLKRFLYRIPEQTFQWIPMSSRLSPSSSWHQRSSSVIFLRSAPPASCIAIQHHTFCVLAILVLHSQQAVSYHCAFVWAILSGQNGVSLSLPPPPTLSLGGGAGGRRY